MVQHGQQWQQEVRYNNNMKKGETMSQEQKTKISANRKGKALGNTNGFVKGQISSFKGKKHTGEANQKNREKHLGKLLGNQNGFKKGQDAWNKGKPSPWSTKRNLENNPNKGGESHPMWKGGSIKYVSKQALLRENYTCQVCGLYEPEIVEVDHILPKCIYPELRLDINNLQVLCPNCHKRKTLKDVKSIVQFKNASGSTA